MRNHDYWEDADGDRIDYHGVNYGKHWQQIMPVWYKFRLLTLEESNFTSEFIALKRSIEYSILNAGIETACRLLAEGIRWYNTINK